MGDEPGGDGEGLEVCEVMLCTLSPMLPGLGTALDKRRGNCRLIPVQGLDPLITNISPGEQN